MDWLVFRDPRVAPLVSALTGGMLQWLGHPSMLQELRHVLGRGVAAGFAPDLGLIDEQFARFCRMSEQASPPAVRLVCRDPDDQKFIDLAIASGAQWLFSRDRAVLALAKRARAYQLTIRTPDGWQLPDPSLAGIARPTNSGADGAN